ncbi:MAG: hypothetical protein PVJ21_01400 [Anaerolineales bacterium]|jgi:hypothetical protein
MSQQIVYIDTSAIGEGKLEELKRAMKALTSFVEENMPQLISYGFFLNQNQSQITVVAVHPDSASLENHLDVGAAEFQKFAELIDLLKIEVYGPISDAVHERLQQKARMLGRGTLTVHDFYTGFAR